MKLGYYPSYKIFLNIMLRLEVCGREMLSICVFNNKHLRLSVNRF